MGTPLGRARIEFFSALLDSFPEEKRVFLEKLREASSAS
jgi:hypothetical protein